MSLSVNNPSFMKVNASVLDRNSLSSAKLGETTDVQVAGARVANTPLSTDNSRFSPNELMIPGAALTRLFDMLEQVFKAIREMVAGKDLTPALLSGPGVVPDGKPEARTLPVNSEVAKQPSSPDVGNLPAKPQGPEPQAKLQLMDAAVVVPAALKAPAALPHLPAPEPAITVTNDGKTNVHVNVNAGHCHCTQAQAVVNNVPRLKRVLDLSPLPETAPQPGIKPGVTPDLKADTTPEHTPGVPGTITPEVESDTKPSVPPAPKTEITPDHTHAVPGIVTPVVTPEPTPSVVPDIAPKPLPDTPVPDLTSPGPVEDHFDPRNWRLNTKPMFKA